jgi:hypothetical protein
MKISLMHKGMWAMDQFFSATYAQAGWVDPLRAHVYYLGRNSFAPTSQDGLGGIFTQKSAALMSYSRHPCLLRTAPRGPSALSLRQRSARPFMTAS